MVTVVAVGLNPPLAGHQVALWTVNRGSGSAQSSSAEAQTLVFAHVGAQEEGLELPFALDVDEAAALAGVAESLEHQRRLLRHLQRGGGATLRLSVCVLPSVHSKDGHFITPSQFTKSQRKL